MNYPAHPYVYTPSLHDALPSSASERRGEARAVLGIARSPLQGFHTGRRAERTRKTPRRIDVAPLASSGGEARATAAQRDRKSTRLNSSHLVSSYAGFCLKKKTN